MLARILKIYFNVTLLTPFAFNATPLFKSNPHPQTLSHTPAPANQTTTPLKFRAKFSATQSQCPNRPPRAPYSASHLRYAIIKPITFFNLLQNPAHHTLTRPRPAQLPRAKPPCPNRLARTQNQPTCAKF